MACSRCRGNLHLVPGEVRRSSGRFVLVGKRTGECWGLEENAEPEDEPVWECFAEGISEIVNLSLPKPSTKNPAKAIEYLKVLRALHGDVWLAGVIAAALDAPQEAPNG
jgi:hypothetical protein